MCKQTKWLDQECLKTIEKLNGFKKHGFADFRTVLTTTKNGGEGRKKKTT